MKKDLAKRKVSRYLVLSPVVRDKKGAFTSLFDNLKAKGFTQVRVDKYVKDLDEEFLLIKTNKHRKEPFYELYHRGQKVQRRS